MRLKKPIVSAINTHSVSVEKIKKTNPKDIHQIEGGTHWICFVILPRHFKPRFKPNLRNEQEIVFFIDSLGHDRLPENLKKAIISGFQSKIELDGGRTFEKQAVAVLPDAEFDDRSLVHQQKGSSDCGWWVLYNIAMLLFEGSTEYLSRMRQPSSTAGKRLREIFNGLDRLGGVSVNTEHMNKDIDARAHTHGTTDLSLVQDEWLTKARNTFFRNEDLWWEAIEESIRLYEAEYKKGSQKKQYFPKVNKRPNNRPNRRNGTNNHGYYVWKRKVPVAH